MFTLHKILLIRIQLFSEFDYHAQKTVASGGAGAGSFSLIVLIQNATNNKSEWLFICPRHFFKMKD